MSFLGSTHFSRRLQDGCNISILNLEVSFCHADLLKFILSVRDILKQYLLPLLLQVEEELRRLIERFEQAEGEATRRRLEYGNQIVPCILKMPIEGFVSIENEIIISDDLQIERVSGKGMQEFFARAANLELTDYKQEDNCFFITYKFEEVRRAIGGTGTGNRILLLAIFFAICTDKRVRINKGQGFVSIEGEQRSIGITRIPNGPWFYDRNSNFDASSIQKLQTSWPLFKQAFNGQPHFALVARRYYFSLIRTQWEDQLIDLIIALEALLVPESDEKNKSGKISKRLSRLLKDNFPRGQVVKVAREGYDLRNKVIHGEHDYESIGIHSSIDVLKDYVKAALTIYLFKYSGLPARELAQELDNMDGRHI